jgi:galactose-1-phosphate uridylyltransferase
MQALVSKLEAIEAYRKYSQDDGGELFRDLIADETRHAERLVDELRECLRAR